VQILAYPQHAALLHDDVEDLILISCRELKAVQD
jgi:hypothetical protein